MEDRRLLSLQELAGYLGVPVTTCYQWRHPARSTWTAGARPTCSKRSSSLTASLGSASTRRWPSWPADSPDRRHREPR